MNAIARALTGILLTVMASRAAAWLPANAETTAPEDKSIQAVIEEYWADSTGRRNTFSHILF